MTRPASPIGYAPVAGSPAATSRSQPRSNSAAKAVPAVPRPPPPVAGLLRSARERRFGETLVVFYWRAAPEDVPPPSGA